jgi:hypothetical protein
MFSPRPARQRARPAPSATSTSGALAGGTTAVELTHQILDPIGQACRLIDFRRPVRRSTPSCGGHRVRSESFDLLGFTHYWAVSRKGNWVVKQKTAADRVDIHAGPKQVDGRRMSKRMRADALHPQGMRRFGRFPHRTRDQVVNAEPVPGLVDGCPGGMSRVGSMQEQPMDRRTAR